MDENTKRFEWEVAELNFRHNYDKQFIIEWLPGSAAKHKTAIEVLSSGSPDFPVLANLPWRMK
jgi:hypothetical protein